MYTVRVWYYANNDKEIKLAQKTLAKAHLWAEKAEKGKTYYDEECDDRIWTEVHLDTCPQIGWQISLKTNDWDWQGEVDPLIGGITINCETNVVEMELSFDSLNFSKRIDKLFRDSFKPIAH